MDKSNIIWVEKYRPHHINKIIQQDEIKQLISSKNNVSNLPHLLFYGPPGTGKTTTSLAICKHIFSSNLSNLNQRIFKERILELNASDERGIKIVREKIKTFASHALNYYEGVPSFKIIILDEADVMTNDSQFALRRIMEQYSHITRFILICNYVTKIIPPLSSRCYRYRFNCISLSSMKTIIINILNQEEISYNDNLIEDIIININSYSNGDLRKAITLLQRAVYVSKLNNVLLNGELIDDVIGIIPNTLINQLYIILNENNNSYQKMTSMIKTILNKGYSSTDIINKLSTKILNDSNIGDNIKSSIFLKMSDISNLLSCESGDYIQLLALCSYINHILI